MRYLVVLVLFLSFLLLVQAVPPAGKDAPPLGPPKVEDLSGYYAVDGKIRTADNELRAYSGIMQMKKVDDVYHISQVPAMIGVGLLQGGTMSVSLCPVGAANPMVMRMSVEWVDGKPKLSGKWVGMNTWINEETWTFLRCLN